MKVQHEGQEGHELSDDLFQKIPGARRGANMIPGYSGSGNAEARD